MKISANQSEKGKGGGAGLIIGIVCGVVVLLVLIGVIIFLLAGKSKTAKEETPEEDHAKDVVTAENIDQIAEELLAPDDRNIPQSYTVTQNSEWNFPDGSSESTNAYVENEKSNETPVYFDIIVEETGEVVYSSPVLELGASIENFKLDKPLPAGSYSCIVEYHLVDENQETLTTVDIGTTLVIEK